MRSVEVRETGAVVSGEALLEPIYVLHECGLVHSLCTALENAGYARVIDLAHVTPGELRSVNGFGAKRITAIQEALRKYLGG